MRDGDGVLGRSKKTHLPKR